MATALGTCAHSLNGLQKGLIISLNSMGPREEPREGVGPTALYGRGNEQYYTDTAGPSPLVWQRLGVSATARGGGK
jgi:hypothetical protein